MQLICSHPQHNYRVASLNWSQGVGLQWPSWLFGVCCFISGVDLLEYAVVSGGYFFQMHLETHSAQKNYGCIQCGKKFAQPGNLKIHLIRHTGIKNIACTVCDMKFYVKVCINSRIICGLKIWCYKWINLIKIYVKVCFGQLTLSRYVVSSSWEIKFRPPKGLKTTLLCRVECQFLKKNTPR